MRLFILVVLYTAYPAWAANLELAADFSLSRFYVFNKSSYVTQRDDEFQVKPRIRINTGQYFFDDARVLGCYFYAGYSQEKYQIDVQYGRIKATGVDANFLYGGGTIFVNLGMTDTGETDSPIVQQLIGVGLSRGIYSAKGSIPPSSYYRKAEYIDSSRPANSIDIIYRYTKQDWFLELGWNNVFIDGPPTTDRSYTEHITQISLGRQFHF